MPKVILHGQSQKIDVLPIEKGGTGATTSGAALLALNGQEKAIAKIAVIEADQWQDNQQTIILDEVMETDNIIVAPNDVSFISWGKSLVRASEQGNGTITFVCASVPEETLIANVLIMR